MGSPLINKKYLLEKFPGKGGWTYALIPEILQNKKAPFGWVKVKGAIDGYEIKSYHLMPMGNERLFLPVKAEIRKRIGKKEGDYVNIILYPDNDPIEIPEELLISLLEEPVLYKKFLNFTDGQQKAYIDWIFSAKTIETKANRIAQSLERVAKGKRFYDKENAT